MVFQRWPGDLNHSDLSGKQTCNKYDKSSSHKQKRGKKKFALRQVENSNLKTKHLSAREKIRVFYQFVWFGSADEMLLKVDRTRIF